MCGVCAVHACVWCIGVHGAYVRVVCTCVCKSVHRGQRKAWGVLLYHPSFPLRNSLSLKLELVFLKAWQPVNKPQKSSCICPSQCGVTGLCETAPGSWMGPDRPSFACEQELLNTRPSLPPLYLDPCEVSFPLFLYLLFCLRRSCYVAQVGLNSFILLPQPLGCWDSRHETLHPA